MKDIDSVPYSDVSITKKFLCDATKKYFWTYPFWAHGNYLKQSPTKSKMYMDDSATRARAGLLNLIGWSVMVCSFVIPQYSVILYAGPFIIFDMLTGTLFGLTPFCPTGVIGTIIAWNIKPYYKPAIPKRLAWTMGAGLGASCMIIRIFVGAHFILKCLIGVCIVLTWLEAVLGFCMGCWMYGKIVKCTRTEPIVPTNNYKGKTRDDRQNEDDVDIDTTPDTKESESINIEVEIMEKMRNEDNKAKDDVINVDAHLCTE